MKLATKRLILREITMKDAESLIENISNLNVSRYLLVVPSPYTLKNAKWWINHCKEREKEKPRTSYNLHIQLKPASENPGIIGGVGLSHIDREQGTCNIGYWLGEQYWGRGIMTESATAMIDFAFQKLKLRRIRIPAFAVNNASNGLAKKLGFQYEGTLRKAGVAKSTGKIHDENIYGMLREEWAGAKKRLR